MLAKTKVNTQTVEVAQTQAFTAIPLHSTDVIYTKAYSMQINATVSTPSAGTFTADPSTDICTKSAHAFKTGCVVRLTTTTTLPGGLATATDYYVIVIDANTFKLATSLVNANAGTAINITTTGTGTHTVTPTSLAGCSWKFQISNDNTTWIDLGSTTNITVSTNSLTEKVDPAFGYIRLYVAITAGQVTFVVTTLCLGEA